IATFGLIIIGFKQSRDAREATRIARENLKLTPEIERAYVSGGGCRIVSRRLAQGMVQLVEGEELITQSDGTLVIVRITSRFEVHINNHGKTPSRVHHMRIGFFDAAVDPPPVPPLK